MAGLKWVRESLEDSSVDCPDQHCLARLGSTSLSRRFIVKTKATINYTMVSQVFPTLLKFMDSY